ncbi:putative membrane protein [Drosera capensis]
MLNIDTNSSATSSVQSGSNSGHQSSQKPNLSGPMSRKSSGSGPIPLQPTGLITSGPIGSNRTTTAQSVQNDGFGKGKIGYGSGVTSVNKGVMYGIRVSKGVMWVVVVVGLMGLVGLVHDGGSEEWGDVGRGWGGDWGLLGLWLGGVGWSWVWEKRGVREWVEGSEDSELREAVDGQCVKVSGIVTCSSTPLESSFQKVPRCVYVSTELLEYKGCRGKSANPRHHRFSWGRRYSELVGRP